MFLNFVILGYVYLMAITDKLGFSFQNRVCLKEEHRTFLAMLYIPSNELLFSIDVPTEKNYDALFSRDD